ncbi:MAG TPA: decaprenyl-phosphate phosphoribosyltransferase [Acidimicrobiales bacterium]|nr:decaprenyl-phosphate phosphoribosyltransferase [Acidimicrobiales bacterium]
MQDDTPDAATSQHGSSSSREAAVGLLAAMRPRQWVKNVLVGVAPAAAGKAFHLHVAARTAVAFVAFSLAASGVYLINDLRDAEADRAHPTKRLRPIARGTVPPGLAAGAATVLVCAALAIAVGLNWRLGVVVAIYVAESMAYSFGCKRLSVIELGLVASGFVLRAIAGGVASGLPLSSWFLLVISFGALFVVVGKRLAEFKTLGDGAGAHRLVLENYTQGFLQSALILCAGVTVTAYCLWAFTPDSSGLSVHHAALWIQLSVVPVVLAVLYVLLHLDAGGGGAPEDLVLKDRTVQGLAACWAILVAIGVYR